MNHMIPINVLDRQAVEIASVMSAVEKHIQSKIGRIADPIALETILFKVYRLGMKHAKRNK